jgi:hypothetical protein
MNINATHAGMNDSNRSIIHRILSEAAQRILSECGAQVMSAEFEWVDVSSDDGPSSFITSVSADSKMFAPGFKRAPHAKRYKCPGCGHQMDRSVMAVVFGSGCPKCGDYDLSDFDPMP